MQNSLSPIDRKILRLLQHNAELSAAEVAEKVELSQSPCWRRIHRMQQDGLIERKVALLNHKLLGFSITVFVDIKLSVHGRRGRLPGSAGVLQHGRRLGLPAQGGGQGHQRLRALPARSPAAATACARGALTHRHERGQMHHRTAAGLSRPGISTAHPFCLRKPADWPLKPDTARLGAAMKNKNAGITFSYGNVQLHNS